MRSRSGRTGARCIPKDFYPYVDAPGELVPPGATEVTLCSSPTEPFTSPLGLTAPRQRVLRVGAADFTAWLNRLPDRNSAWRQIQRRDSGWWPDAAPLPLGEVCLLDASTRQAHSFVLHYTVGPPVPLVLTCGGALTTGARTRLDYFEPNAVDEFERRFQTQ